MLRRNSENANLISDYFAPVEIDIGGNKKPIVEKVLKNFSTETNTESISKNNRVTIKKLKQTNISDWFN